MPKLHLRRTALSLELSIAMASCCRDGWKIPRSHLHVAALVLILRITYMRPSELLEFKKKDIVPSLVPLLPFWSVVTAVCETGAFAKKGIPNGSVLFADERRGRGVPCQRCFFSESSNTCSSLFFVTPRPATRTLGVMLIDTSNRSNAHLHLPMDMEPHLASSGEGGEREVLKSFHNTVLAD